MRMANKIIMLAASLVMLTACAGGPSMRVSDAAYLEMSAEERADYRVRSSEEREILAEKRAMDDEDFRNFIPIRVGDARTGATMQCLPTPGEFNAVMVYPGHQPPDMFATESEGQVMMLANNDCEIQYFEDARGGRRPVTIIANMANEEGRGRLLSKAATQIGAAVISGPLSQLVANQRGCTGSCGVTYANIVEGAIALADADASSDSRVTTSGRCGSISCDAYMGGGTST